MTDPPLPLTTYERNNVEKYLRNGRLPLSAGFFQRFFVDGGQGSEAPIVQIHKVELESERGRKSAKLTLCDGINVYPECRVFEELFDQLLIDGILGMVGHQSDLFPIILVKDVEMITSFYFGPIRLCLNSYELLCKCPKTTGYSLPSRDEMISSRSAKTPKVFAQITLEPIVNDASTSQRPSIAPRSTSKHPRSTRYRSKSRPRPLNIAYKDRTDSNANHYAGSPELCGHGHASLNGSSGSFTSAHSRAVSSGPAPRLGTAQYYSFSPSPTPRQAVPSETSDLAPQLRTQNSPPPPYSPTAASDSVDPRKLAAQFSNKDSPSPSLRQASPYLSPRTVSRAQARPPPSHALQISSPVHAPNGYANSTSCIDRNLGSPSRESVILLDKLAQFIGKKIDVIAMVHQVGPIEQTTCEGGQIRKLRTIDVTDRSSVIVKWVLWDEEALTFSEDNKGTDILITGALVRKRAGAGTLRGGIYVELSHSEEAWQLINWHKPRNTVQETEDNSPKSAEKLALSVIPLSEIARSPRKLIDILAVVDNVHAVVRNPLDNKTNMRKVQLVDESCAKINLILFGRKATQFATVKGTVIGIQGCEVKEDPLTGSLYVTDGKRLVINPEVRGVAQLQEWYTIDYLDQ